jgi:hypothetical protein
VADIDLQIVREFFELNRFNVITRWPQHDGPGAADGGVQLYVRNAGLVDDAKADVALHPAQIRRIRNAVVEIRPWHTERFYASLIDGNPILTQFAETEALGHAEDFFGGEEFTTILVVSELPRTAEQRAHAIKRIEQTGVRHVLEFPALLQDLIERVVLSGSYTGSPALQLLQLLKRYRLLRMQQLEFAFPRDPSPYRQGGTVDATVPPDDAD